MLIAMDVEFVIDREIALMDQMEQLKQEIDEARSQIRPPSQLDGTEGRLSRQDSMLRHELEKATLREREKRLPQLKEALDRIDQGVFGRCEACRKEIGRDRLTSVPEAVLCEACFSVPTR